MASWCRDSLATWIDQQADEISASCVTPARRTAILAVALEYRQGMVAIPSGLPGGPGPSVPAARHVRGGPRGSRRRRRAPGAYPAVVSQSGESRTATFLMTDIEGSTRLWEEQRAEMASPSKPTTRCSGRPSRRPAGRSSRRRATGCWRPSTDAEAALTAAIEGQRALERPRRGRTTGPLRVRMAIHSGSAEVRDGDFFGPAAQPGGAPPRDRPRRPGARLGHDRGAGGGRPPARVRADRPGRAPPARPGPARARLPARRCRACAASSRRCERPPSTPPTSGPRPRRSWAASGSWPTSGGCSRRSRLVTLVGVGGTGKTRLELQVAADALDRYRDGAWLVELAPLSDPELVVAEIGRALGVQPQPGQAPDRHGRRLPALQGAAPAPRQLRAPHRRRRRRGRPPARQLSRPPPARLESRAARRRRRGRLRRALAGAAGGSATSTTAPRRSTTRRSSGPIGPRRSGCSSIARPRPCRRSRSIGRTCGPSSRSAGGSTASRSPSSWRPPGSTSSPPTRSPRASATGSAC